MSEFLYLYRGSRPSGSPEEMQQVMQKWMNWLSELGSKGHLKAPGHPLEQSGKVVTGKARVVTDGPFAEKDVVGGYSIVEAKSIEEATELANGCPIFDFAGGTVEVRPIMQM
ncbi:MAG TPA: YciI family protein [Fimbriimonadaceae bacterium]|nr:YciI family protein [Fimbriimonadaceae bacterium]